MHSLTFVYIFAIIKLTKGQDETPTQPPLNTSGLALCKTVVEDETATLMLAENAAVNVDNTSVASYGKDCQFAMQNEAKQTLKIQSGFRLQKKAVCNVGERSTVSYTESSHVTVGGWSGQLDICRDVVVTLEGSRVLVMGKADIQANCKLDMYDCSVFRVYECGFMYINVSTSIEMARGASFETSEWWQMPGDDIKARTTIGARCQISLLDRSSFQVGKGCFNAQDGVVIKLEAQANFLLKGEMNMTENSQLIMGSQSKIQIGSTERRFDSDAAPSLIFLKRALTLEMGERASLTIEKGARCILTTSVKINDTVVLTADSKDKPYVGCFATLQELYSAMSSMPQ